MKHQANYPWLTHACIVTLQPVLALLGKISSNFNNQEFLKAGDSLRHDKHEKLMRLMKDTIERLQIGMVTNSIAHHGKAPKSYNYFQLSIEWISP